MLRSVTALTMCGVVLMLLVIPRLKTVPSRLERFS